MINILFTIFLFNGLAGKIQGVVKDEETGKPILNVDVIVLNTEIGAATDEQGNFYILNVPAGRYTVVAMCIGYQTNRIEDVMVEIDQTTRLKINLKQTPIEIAPVTITSERPVVQKDMVGTTYIVGKNELGYLPIDYSANFVMFQPAVASVDTAIHVRGGRATEVQYMIDNVSIIDPQTGDLAINISKGIVDEVIFLPGGFDAEYGRAMSGIINIITTHPADNLQFTVQGKTERIMPFYYDFGYENFQSSVHLPVSKRFKGIIAFDVMHTNDWDPKLFVLPHKQRADYSLYGKWFFVPSGKLKLSVSTAQSRTQFDRYTVKWKFNLDHYRSDMRQGELQALNINYLPSTRSLFNITLSRLNTKRIYGVREPGPYGFLENFAFRDYQSLQWPLGSIHNAYGVFMPLLPIEGDYPEYQDKSSQILKGNLSIKLQIRKHHEINTGTEYSYLDLKNFSYFISDTLHQIIDEYQYHPTEYSFYLQDNIDYEGLYAKIGARYDYFSSDISGVEPKIIISPRLGFSFMVTDRFLFRTNVGKYAQPPLYDYMYGYYNLLPLPSYLVKNMPLIGNPELGPEKTTSYEIGLQGEISKNFMGTVNIFYKDVSDLVGTRLANVLPSIYVSYINVEYANVKGIETILEFTKPQFSGKISYTLSYACGSSSYAADVYDWYYRENPDTTYIPPTQDYFLDFDQRHRIFMQGAFNLPFQTKFYVFGYFGNGFPYTPPGPEGKFTERNIQQFPFQKQVDWVISKSFKIGKLSINTNIDIINLLDERYEIALHGPLIPLDDINPWDFTDYISIDNSYYSPAADFNHDGLITPLEEYTAYRALIEDTDDWINSYTAPRRARVGMSISF